MSLATRAGYNPAALIPAVHGIERSVENLTGENHKAELLRCHDNSGEETISLYYLFLTSGKVTYTVMSMGREHYRDILVPPGGRVRSEWFLELTGIMSSLVKNRGTLEAGALLKVARSERYVPK
jgi:hypothetical protein